MSERILIGTTSHSVRIGRDLALRPATTRRSGTPDGMLARLRHLLRRLAAHRRTRLLPLDGLPGHLLRDVDPARHDAITGLYTGWSGLDAQFRSAHC